MNLLSLRKRMVGVVAAAAVVGATLVSPTAAWAKSDYGVTIKEQRVQVGQTLHVTVTIGDDSGIDRNTTMCLYQVLGNHPRVTPGKMHGPYRKIGVCRRPAVSRSDPYTGVVRYTLKATSSGWLTLVAFRGHGGKPEMGRSSCICAVSKAASVRGRGGAKPKATPAKLSLVSVKS